MLLHLILSIRHLMYDKGLLKSSGTDIPSVCVGNLALGGTGKTPMTELIVRTLLESAPKRRIAVLSRGYGRKTKGFQVVTSDGDARMFGDEPVQVKKKFPQLTVAVDEDRVEGASFLADSSIAGPGPEILILDDAFQHRRIKADKNILLTTYDRPFFSDRLMPFGRLRDLRSRALAADMIIVTKCPDILEDKDRESYLDGLKITDFDKQTCSGTNRVGKRQTVLFAKLEYDTLLPVFPEGDVRYVHSKNAIVFTGIANDALLVQQLYGTYRIIDHFSFPDHHFFEKSDIKPLVRTSEYSPTSIIITSEKDARRLECLPTDTICQDIRKRLFYAPIRTSFATLEEFSVFKAFLEGLC